MHVGIEAQLMRREVHDLAVIVIAVATVGFHKGDVFVFRVSTATGGAADVL